MDLSKVLAHLRQELNYINAAILSLERLQAKGSSRRGRPSRALLELRKHKTTARRTGNGPRNSGRGFTSTN
jgi:hypothetical protein